MAGGLLDEHLMVCTDHGDRTREDGVPNAAIEDDRHGIAQSATVDGQFLSRNSSR
jgi:hypothetical protein